MLHRALLLAGAVALLAAPALGVAPLYDDSVWHTPPHAPGYPDASFSCDTATFQCTSVSASFSVAIGTPVWWDHASVQGIPTGAPYQETQAFEVRNSGPVLVTAETFPVNTPDTPKVCTPDPVPRTPDVVPPTVGTVVVHGVKCTKDNGYTVQVHYFLWSTDPNDPDGVPSITPQEPLATTNWRVDAMPTSYKEAVLPAPPGGGEGRYQVWIHPGIGPSTYDIVFTVTPLDGNTPFWFDYLGTRGCPFYEYPAQGVGDQALLGCPNGYLP